MFISSTMIQLKVMFKKKDYKIAFLLVLLFACVSFLYAVSQYKGTDLSLIKDANQCVALSMHNRLFYFFTFAYPFIVVLPCALSYVDDYKNRIIPIYLSRISRRTYYTSKLFACFCGTIFIMAIPFIFNLLLCNMFFPHNYNTFLGEYQLPNFYRNLLGLNRVYESAYQQMPFLRLFQLSPLLYNLLYILIFSAFSGLLSSFIMSLSFVLSKSKMLLFVPLFAVLQVLQVYSTYSFSHALSTGDRYINTNILHYIVPGAMFGLTPGFIIVITALMLLVMVGLTVSAIHADLKSMQ